MGRLLRFAQTLLEVTTPVATDQVGATYRIVPSSRDRVPETDQQFFAWLRATQSGGVTSPTTDVTIETSQDGSTWFAVTSITQLTTDETITEFDLAGQSGPLLAYVRAVTALGGGTPPNHSVDVQLVSDAPFTLQEV